MTVTSLIVLSVFVFLGGFVTYHVRKLNSKTATPEVSGNLTPNDVAQLQAAIKRKNAQAPDWVKTPYDKWYLSISENLFIGIYMVDGGYRAYVNDRQALPDTYKTLDEAKYASYQALNTIARDIKAFLP